jgi:AraC-like DNA-binding protein
MKGSIKKYPFKEGLKLEFEVLDLADRISKSGSMMHVPHRAQFYHILWIEKGHGTHYVDFKPLSIEDQTIIFIPQNSVNKYDCKGYYEGKAILFTDSFFSRTQEDITFLNFSMLFSDLYPTAKFKFPAPKSPLINSLLGMEAEYNRTFDFAQYMILQNMLHVFLLQSEREMQAQGFKELKRGPGLNILFNFKQLLEQHFHKEKSVKHYALQLNISEKQLHKATTSLLDKTPKAVINDRVLLEAKRLLAHSNQPVKEIAYELGYDEPTNFIKFFRKYTHTTPTEFREQN